MIVHHVVTVRKIHSFFPLNRTVSYSTFMSLCEMRRADQRTHMASCQSVSIVLVLITEGKNWKSHLTNSNYQGMVNGHQRMNLFQQENLVRGGKEWTKREGLFSIAILLLITRRNKFSLLMVPPGSLCLLFNNNNLYERQHQVHGDVASRRGAQYDSTKTSSSLAKLISIIVRYCIVKRSH